MAAGCLSHIVGCWGAPAWRTRGRSGTFSLDPGTDAVYAYEIYDGLKPADAAGLEMATALLRDGRVIYQSPFAPVTTPPRRGGKVRAIPN